MDPNPPPPATYLDELHVKVRISSLHKSPSSLESSYKQMMCRILGCIFTTPEGFFVLQEEIELDMHPDLTVFK